MRDPLAGIHVRQIGAGAHRLFLHCSLGVGDMLLPLARALPSGRNTLFDLPGHGRSAQWRDAAQDGDYPTRTIEVAAALLKEPTHVIGHSYGAAAALRLAAEYPGLISRLTLIEPVFFAVTRGTAHYDAYEAMFAPFVAAWDAGDRGGAAAAFIGMWGFGTPWDAMPKTQRKGIIDRIHLVPAAVTLLEQDQTGVAMSLSSIRCPVDLIEGSRTQPIVPAIHDALERQLPRVDRHVVDGAGHMVPISDPSGVANALGLATA